MHLIKHHVLSLIAKGAFTAAIAAAADFARRNPDRAACFGLLAQAEESAGYTKAAIQSASQAIVLAPLEPAYRIQRGRLYLKDGRLRESISDVNCIIAMGNARHHAAYLGDAIACRDELLERLACNQATRQLPVFAEASGHCQ